MAVKRPGRPLAGTEGEYENLRKISFWIDEETRALLDQMVKEAKSARCLRPRGQVIRQAILAAAGAAVSEGATDLEVVRRMLFCAGLGAKEESGGMPRKSFLRVEDAEPGRQIAFRFSVEGLLEAVFSTTTLPKREPKIVGQ